MAKKLEETAALEKVNGQNTLQTKIVKRFMTDEEWYEFRKEYLDNRKGWGGHKRSYFLSQKVSQEDKDLLKTYLEDTDIMTRDMAPGKTASQVGQIVRMTALRLLYQNEKILSKLLGE